MSTVLSGMDPSWKKVHLVGIGGSGMSAIARVLGEAGHRVSGSDLRESSVLSTLRALGAKVDVGHVASQAQEADLVIYSAAVGPDNVELECAKHNDIPTISRGEALSLVVKGLRTIAVSGTHGKTTTSGMLATVFEHAGKDPVYLMGADPTAGGAGGKLGAGEIAVIEADEAYESFLHLRPSVSVVNNIDEDHMDFYGSMDALKESFRRFMFQTTEKVVVCRDDAAAFEVAGEFSPTTYGFSEKADFRAVRPVIGPWGCSFELIVSGRDEGSVELKVGGRHNILNALGAVSASVSVGLDIAEAVDGLKEFAGLHRRFQYRGNVDGADLVDDYAHNPAKVRAALAGAEHGPWKRLIVAFQPHLYSRTQTQWRQFGESLSRADVVVVTDVYGAREEPVPGVTGKLIVDAVCETSPGKKVAYLPRLDEAADYLLTLIRPGDLVLSLGAGDVTTLHDRLAVK